MSGQELFRALILATGLPEHEIEPELLALMQTRGLTMEKLTLEDVRELLATYLQDVLLEAKSRASG